MKFRIEGTMFAILEKMGEPFASDFRATYAKVPGYPKPPRGSNQAVPLRVQQNSTVNVGPGTMDPVEIAKLGNTSGPMAVKIVSVPAGSIDRAKADKSFRSKLSTLIWLTHQIAMLNEGLSGGGDKPTPWTCVCCKELAAGFVVKVDLVAQTHPSLTSTLLAEISLPICGQARCRSVCRKARELLNMATNGG